MSTLHELELMNDARVTFLANTGVLPAYAASRGFVLLECARPLCVLGGADDVFQELEGEEQDGVYKYVGHRLAVVAPNGIFLLQAGADQVETTMVLEPQEVV